MKFFRKLRERMLWDNKISKYLLYAIGEIFLVLIGILLALKINAWQQSKNDKQTIGLHISAILDETRKNISELNSVVNQMQYYSKEALVLLDLYKSKDFSNPLMEQKTQFLYSNSIFVPATSSFENLKNSTVYALIDNFAVKKSLSEAYTTFDEIKTAEEVDIIPKTAFYTDYVLPNGFLIGSMPKSEAFYSTPYFGNMIMTVLQTNKEIESKASVSLNAIQGLEGVLKRYHSTLDIGPLKERTTISEYIENGTSPEEIISLVKQQDPNNPEVVISEDILNNYGYILLRQGDILNALKIFKLNIEIHPNSFNTYDSYGEALLIKGDTINAVKAYKKSYELNASNTNGRSIVKDFENR